MSEFVVKCGHERRDGECVAQVNRGYGSGFLPPREVVVDCDGKDHSATDAARVAVCEAATEVLRRWESDDSWDGSDMDPLYAALSVFKEE